MNVDNDTMIELVAWRVRDGTIRYGRLGTPTELANYIDRDVNVVYDARANLWYLLPSMHQMSRDQKSIPVIPFTSRDAAIMALHLGCSVEVPR